MKYYIVVVVLHEHDIRLVFFLHKHILEKFVRSKKYDDTSILLSWQESYNNYPVRMA